MKIFIITDTHFGHEALTTKCKTRPPNFQKKLVEAWRRDISGKDLVIHLGDVMVDKSTEWKPTISRLPGRKILVQGNHDKKSANWYMANGFDFCCVAFHWEMFGLRIVFSHEPISHGEFDLNIHGHLHQAGRHRGNETDKRHCLLSLEHSGYRPHSLKSIVEGWSLRNV